MNVDEPIKAQKHLLRSLESLFEKSLLFEQRGHLQEAIELYQQGLKVYPASYELHHNLANLYLQIGSLPQSLAHYKRTIELNPTYADAYVGCANVMGRLKTYGPAIDLCLFALSLDPDHLAARFNLANFYRSCEQLKLALHHYQGVLKEHPHFLHARLSKLLATLPRLYQNSNDILKARAHYRRELAKLEKQLPFFLSGNQQPIAEILGTCYPYFLPYQGKNDRLLQQRFGKIACAIIAHEYPSLTQPMEKTTVDGRLRVGFVSGFFSHHSVWKIPLQGWLEKIDRSQFETYSYATGLADRELLNQAEHARCGLSLQALAKKIQQDQLHALIFPEIGMDAKSFALACMRLAPLQCTGLGHPQTSGLVTIDYFLSSELMEPPGAQSHYSERLVCLQGLGISYLSAPACSEEPAHLPDNWQDSSIKYLCCQSLFKYLPHDELVWTSLIKQLPTAQLVFTSTPQELADLFFARLKRAFDKAGLCYEQQVVRLPRLSRNQFAGLCLKCDLFLDAVGWSGFNSTLEALQQRLPVITLPGRLARERHSMALLRFLNLEELIATTWVDYVQQAITLGLDRKKRERIQQAIERSLPKLYNDTQAIRSFENFLQKACR